MSLFRKICCCGLVLGSILLLAGCDRTTPEEHYENAREYFAAKQIRTAVIELKNALQKAPDFADARFLLAESHAELGDFPSALKEYERSLDLGQDTEEVKVGLLKAKVRLGRHQEVIGELEGTGSHREGMTVLDVILEAGGTNEFASPAKTTLFRVDGQRLDVKLDRILKKGDMKTNYTLSPGDIVTVPERIF